MIEKNFTVVSETGLQAKTTTKIAQVASQFQSDIKLEVQGKQVDLKSILGVLSLAIRQNDIIKISASGPDEKEAIETLEQTLKTEGICN